MVTLDDGHKVGVSVGGHGVPLVFLHGLGLSGRAYVRLLSRLAGMGFLVVALDAAGHGGTPNLPRSAADLAHRVDLTVRTLDALGIEKAVFMGHSMGGRMTIQLAAIAPQRVLAAVLLDAAAGTPFDDTIREPVRAPRRAVRALLGAAYDAHGDPLQRAGARAQPVSADDDDGPGAQCAHPAWASGCLPGDHCVGRLHADAGGDA